MSVAFIQIFEEWTKLREQRTIQTHVLGVGLAVDEVVAVIDELTHREGVTDAVASCEALRSS